MHKDRVVRTGFELADHDGDDCSRHPPVTSISLYEYTHYIVYLVCVFSENERL
jgi:hypothetical protein